MSNMQQLLRWLEGESIHNHDPEECCPDFSCCKPELLQPREVREAFVEAFINDDHEAYEGMLFQFLGHAMQLATKEKEIRVYMTDGVNRAVV